MKESLTQNDIKELRYQCRMGYILPPMLFIFGTIFTGGIYTLNFSSNELDYKILLSISIVFAGLAFFIAYNMNWKYISDIEHGRKEVVTKIIQRKESKRDYEAGSGTLYVGQEMKGFDSYSIVVENIRYRVDEKLFFDCLEGDEVLFNYGVKSRHLINIEVKAKPQ